MNPKKEQLKAEEIGLTEKSDRRTEDKGVQARVKDDHTCVVDGCYEPKAPGQTYVCVKHIRT